jgi:hypothetical protein
MNFLLHADRFDRAFVNANTAIYAVIAYACLTAIHLDGFARASLNAGFAARAFSTINFRRHKTPPFN